MDSHTSDYICLIGTLGTNILLSDLVRNHGWQIDCYNDLVRRKLRPNQQEQTETADVDDLDIEEEENVYYALCEDDRVGIERMLRDGLNPSFTFNGENQLGKTALHMCCEKGLIECAKLFMEADARMNARDGWYQTPIMYAVCTERRDMVKIMVDRGADLDKRDRFGKSALHLSVKHETTDVMQELLDGGADIDVSDDLGRTPLWYCAASDGNIKAMECLLKYGADVHIRDMREKRVPLQAALAHSNNDTLKYLELLLDADSPVNSVDEFGHTCVMTLLKRCYTDDEDFTDREKQIVHILLAAGHDIDLLCVQSTQYLWYQYHDTALNLAIMKDMTVATEFLIDVGADPNKHGKVSMKNKRAFPPLITAARENRLHLARLLLQANADMAAAVPDLHDPERLLTPFRCALQHDNFAFVELLLQAGYNLRPETYLWTNVDIPEQLVMNLELWSRLIDHIATPMPLMVLCRYTIRTALGLKLMEKANRLPLPAFLKDMIMLKHL